jgi:hypothetical protein
MDNEYKTYKKLQRLVDYLCGKIENRSIDGPTAALMASKIKVIALKSFPDKSELFDMVYGARFKRLSDQYLSPDVYGQED